jgi:hypothetical protein
LYLVLMQINLNWSRRMIEWVWLPADYDKYILEFIF